MIELGKLLFTWSNVYVTHSWFPSFRIFDKQTARISFARNDLALQGDAKVEERVKKRQKKGKNNNYQKETMEEWDFHLLSLTYMNRDKKS